MSSSGKANVEVWFKIAEVKCRLSVIKSRSEACSCSQLICIDLPNE